MNIFSYSQNFFVDFFSRIVYNVVMDKIRQPQQERSTEKKNKIIEASYEIFSEVGYYNANTSQIAKKAGVSTGIVYSYFKDKRDILLYVLKIYINKVSEPLMAYMKEVKAPLDFEKIVESLTELTIKTHRENSHLHNTLHALSSSDEEVNAQFESLEFHVTDKISEQLISLGVKAEGLKEKVHIAMNFIQSFAHEFVYDNHDYIDYDKMRRYVEKSIVDMFI